MTLFFYIAAFLLFAVLQSIFINGVHIAMDGKERLDKYGNLKPDGDILYFIKRELTKGTIHTELLMGSSLHKVVMFVGKKYKKEFTNDIVMFDKVPSIEYSLNDNQDNLKGFLQTILLNEGIKYAPLDEWITPETKKEGYGYYVLYAETTKYKYNSWIRKSIGGACIKCMSSFYSLITFVPLFIYLFGVRWEIIPILSFNICVLVFLNFFFYKLA